MTTHHTNKGVNNLPVFQIEQHRQTRRQGPKKQAPKGAEPAKQKRAWVRRTPEEKRALYLAKHPGKPGGFRNPWGCNGKPKDADDAMPKPAVSTPSTPSLSVTPMTQPASVALHNARCDSPPPCSQTMRLPRQAPAAAEQEDQEVIAAPALAAAASTNPAVIVAPSLTGEVEPMCPSEPKYTQVCFGGLSFLLPTS